jgi:hypothetical protein
MKNYAKTYQYKMSQLYSHCKVWPLKRRSIVTSTDANFDIYAAWWISQHQTIRLTQFPDVHFPTRAANISYTFQYPRRIFERFPAYTKELSNFFLHTLWNFLTPSKMYLGIFRCVLTHSGIFLHFTTYIEKFSDVLLHMQLNCATLSSVYTSMTKCSP